MIKCRLLSRSGLLPQTDSIPANEVRLTLQVGYNGPELLADSDVSIYLHRQLLASPQAAIFQSLHEEAIPCPAARPGSK